MRPAYISRIKRALLVLVAVGFPAILAAQGYKLEASCEPSSAQMGDTVIYTLSVIYESKVPPDPMPPKFDPAWGFSDPRKEATWSSSNIQQINRQMTVVNTVNYRFSFSVTKEGTYKIPPTGFDLDGNPYRSNPVTVTVRKSAVSAIVPSELQGKVVAPQVPSDATLQNALNGGIFILPIVDPTSEPFDGQQVTLSYYLCVDPEILQRSGLDVRSMSGDDVHVPEYSQFSKDELFAPPRQFQLKERQIGGRRYYVAQLYQTALTPTKTGKLQIEPFSLRLFMTKPGARRASPFGNDPLASMFDDSVFIDPFGAMQKTEIIARSPQIEFNVQAVPPEGKPPGYAGAVGEYNVTSSLDKQTAIANEDVVKLQVKVEGKGDATQIAKPSLPNLDGFTMLEEPKATTDKKVQGDQLVSVKTFDYILRPTKPGKLDIPPVELPAFNPKTKQYAVAKSQPLSLQVEPGSQKNVALVAPQSGPGSAPGGPTTAASNEAPKQVNEDINYIHVAALQAAEPGALSGEGPFFAALIAAPPLLLLAGFVVGRRRANYESNRSYYREVVAGDVARKQLRRAAKLMKDDDRVGFFNELARALRGYFGDKFHIDPSQLTIEQVREQLESRGAENPTIDLTQRLLEQCDLARYTAVMPDAAVLQRAYSDAAQILGAVDKLK